MEPRLSRFGAAGFHPAQVRMLCGGKTHTALRARGSHARDARLEAGWVQCMRHAGACLDATPRIVVLVVVIVVVVVHHLVLQ